jgi:hypothetical protein
MVKLILDEIAGIYQRFDCGVIAAEADADCSTWRVTFRDSEGEEFTLPMPQNFLRVAHKNLCVMVFEPGEAQAVFVTDGGEEMEFGDPWDE